MNKFFIVLLLAISSILLNAQEVFHEWNWQAKSLKEVKGLSYIGGKGDVAFSSEISTTVKTPDGQNTLELKVASPAIKSSHGKSVLFVIKDAKMQTGDRFRIEFDYKGSNPGSGAINSMQGKSPWKPLGKKTIKRLTIHSQWKKAKVEFTVDKDFLGPVYLPMFMFGKYPEGGTINIGPVKVYKVIKNLPLTLNKSWKVFADVGLKCPPLNSFSSIPDSIRSWDDKELNGTECQLASNMINIQKICGNLRPNKSTALLFNEFESAAEGYMQVGMAADWWFECYMNGKKVYSTMTGGNNLKLFEPTNHVFNIDVRKGKNLLVVKARGGSGGWLFVCGSVPFREKVGGFDLRIAGKDWKAINMRKQQWYNGQNGATRPFKFDKLTVKAGTALDFSNLIAPGPAGKYGRVIVNKNGNLAFEKQPDKAVRFRGFNFIPSVWNNFHKMTKKEIEEYAELIRLRGYNIVRIHTTNTFLMKGQHPMYWPRKKKTLAEVKLAQTEDELNICDKMADRFDYFIHCLKQRGIYIYLDLMTLGGPGWSEANKFKKGQDFKEKIYFNEKYRNNWLAGTKYLLKHINPYTKTCLADDPVLAGLEFLNEQDIQLRFLKAFTPAWRESLSKKYENIDKMRSAWDNRIAGKAWPESVKDFKAIPAISGTLLSSGGQSSKDAIAFLQNIMTDITCWYNQQVCDMGFKGFTTQWDMYMRLLDIPPRSLMPVVAMHTYFAHPHRKKLSVKYNQQLLWGIWDKGKEVKISTRNSSLRDGGSYFTRVAVTRFPDRPFMITEFSTTTHQIYAHEHGLFFGAYAALQNWDSLMSFAGVANLYYSPVASFAFGSPSDPITFASEVLMALTWMRGDVKAAPHLIEYSVTPDMVDSPHCLQGLGGDYELAALLTRVGNTYPRKPLAPVGTAKADIEIKPEYFTNVGGSDPAFAVILSSKKDGNAIKSIVNGLRMKNYLNKDNVTDPAKGIYQSETSELVLNSKQSTLKVITSRLEGAIIKKNKLYKLNVLTINSCSIPACFAAASLDRTTSLKDAKHLLLVFSTNACSNKSVYANNGTSVIDQGVFPTLIKTGKISISLSSSMSGKPKVYALNLDGTREEEVACSLASGTLNLEIDMNKLKYATPFFEVVSE